MHCIGARPAVAFPAWGGDGVTTRTPPSHRDLPGFSSLFELGFSDVLHTLVQGVGRHDGVGYALKTDGTVWKWEARQVLVGNVYEPVRYVTKQLRPLEQVTQLAGGSAVPHSRYRLTAPCGDGARTSTTSWT